MDLSHSFTVPVGIEETWTHFQDLAALAECFPGATLTDSDDSSFAGSVKVKLGPIALVYNGAGTFLERDDVAHRFVVDAKGKDKRGNGTAGAKVTLSMTAGADGTTDVEVLTDLAITGKPAQFGRGVMQDVSDKLLGQFVACLEQRLSAGPTASEPVAEPEPEAAPESTPIGDAIAASVPSPSAPMAGAAPEPPARPRPVTTAPPQDDSLDLGAAVLPILAKTYWKQGLGALVVLLLVARRSRRRRRG